MYASLLNSCEPTGGARRPPALSRASRTERIPALPAPAEAEAGSARLRGLAVERDVFSA
jgi:hypothetical protein